MLRSITEVDCVFINADGAGQLQELSAGQLPSWGPSKQLSLLRYQLNVFSLAVQASEVKKAG